ncbi:MAG: MMPL family transporter [Pseudomonadota bacterium]
MPLNGRPWTTAMVCLFVLLNVVSLLALPSLKGNDDYRLLLETSDDNYQRYLQYQESFGAQERDVVVVLRGDMLGPAVLANLRVVADKLLTLGAVESVGSVWNIPWVGRNAEALLAGDELLLRELRDKLASPTYVPARLVSADNRTMLLSVTLNHNITDSTSAVQPAIDQLHGVLQSTLMQGVEYHLAGYPALRADIKTRTDRDAALFGGLSVLFALMVATVVLRRFALVSIAMLVPVSAVICTLGAMSLAGVHINLLNQMVVALVLGITFSDLMHVVRHVKAQQSLRVAASQTIITTYRQVIPACLMTTLTTAVGFAALLLSDSALINQFGWVCALSIVIGFVLLVLALPALVWLIYRYDRRPYRERIPFKPLDVKFDVRLINGFVVGAIVLVCLALQVKTNYQLGENLPSDSAVRVAMDIADTEVGGLIPYAIMLEWPTEVNLRQRLSDLRKLQRELRAQTDYRWLSVTDLMRFSHGFNSLSKFQTLPGEARSRVFDSDRSVALLVTQLPVMDTAALAVVTNTVMQVVDRGIAELNVVSAQPAGMLPLIADVSQQITTDLVKSLIGTFVVISLLVLLMLRSLRLGLLLLIPNSVPLLVIAAVLVLLGQPLQLATVVVFSVCLGIVVDDSIHTMMRYRQHRLSGLPVEQAIDHTMRQIGSVLIHATLIICAGYSVLLFSTTPPVYAVGLLSLMAIPVALLLDLYLLPALIRRFGR